MCVAGCGDEEKYKIWTVMIERKGYKRRKGRRNQEEGTNREGEKGGARRERGAGELDPRLGQPDPVGILCHFRRVLTIFSAS